MTLSEQTNAIILNTLNGVRHNPLSFSSPSFLGRTSRFTSLSFWFISVPALAPWFARLAPFCSGRDLLVAPLFRLVAFLFVLFTWVCLATGASVHRRGRCIGVLLSLCYGSRFVFVLVCLSIDVTGALVLLIRWFCSFLSAARPSFLLSSCLFALLWSCAMCLSSAVSVLSSFSLSVLWLFSCVARWCSCLRCYLWRRGLVVSVGLVLLAVLVWASVFPVLPALPCCASCLCPSCLPCPACSLFCALVQLTLLCAGASLGVSGCSCDGSVALLSCWECGLALLSLRHSVHGNKGYLPCVGFSPSTPCYWWRRGA